MSDASRIEEVSPALIMASEFAAHSENAAGVKHDLVEHLASVAELARQFGEKFHAGELAYWAGFWHDLGKFHPGFQSYISAPQGHRGPDHSSAGAVYAGKVFDWLSFLVAGHHAGLPDRTGLKTRIRVKSDAAEIQTALSLAGQALPRLQPDAPLVECLPRFLRELVASGAKGGEIEQATELFIRMVFSCLVDADFLDTEAHFDGRRALRRAGAPSLEELWKRFEADQASMTGRKHDPLNQIRHEIYQACVAAAATRPGIFRLTVPTGGGKTRSGMAFALRHALRHGLDRVIVALPYTSIIEETAGVYRGIFGHEGVLEHHSAIGFSDEGTDPVSQHDVWARLASENWDAPIVVTTTVQLFESLFANRPAACRKLHNIARSVLILDEVQTLPIHLLRPILDVLQQLVDRYQVTVVLCTATQPALTEGPYIRGLRDVREIITAPARYFAALRRVRYEFPATSERWSWERVAAEMRRDLLALAVVNTKRDAFALLDALDDPTALHLSTQMCGVHRLETLREVRRRLEQAEPCHLVSTQVVEAGVDLDFPLVLRAIGPLDRIVQAAGRCNREASADVGRVLIFDPAEGGSPPGIYRTGTATAAVLLAAGYDLHDPRTYQTYFERLFQAADLDVKRIQTSRQALDFPLVAEKFRLIDDDSAPAVVRPYRHTKEVDSILTLIRRHGEAPRWAFRRLQPYVVNIRSRLILAYQRRGLLQEVAPGLWEWLGRYDRVRGLMDAPQDPGELVI